MAERGLSVRPRHWIGRPLSGVLSVVQCGGGTVLSLYTVHTGTVQSCPDSVPVRTNSAARVRACEPDVIGGAGGTQQTQQAQQMQTRHSSCPPCARTHNRPGIRQATGAVQARVPPRLACLLTRPAPHLQADRLAGTGRQSRTHLHTPRRHTSTSTLIAIAHRRRQRRTVIRTILGTHTRESTQKPAK